MEFLLYKDILRGLTEGDITEDMQTFDVDTLLI